VIRTFIHSFDPASASPVAGTTADLDVSEIEDAGIREVLQTPGAAYGAWSIEAWYKADLSRSDDISSCAA
jgi:hypothetical protein